MLIQKRQRSKKLICATSLNFRAFNTGSSRVIKSFLKEKAEEKIIDWQLVDRLWSEEEREFQYLACDYLRKMKKYLKTTDLPQIYQLATTKSWWETVDSLDELVGTLLLSGKIKSQDILNWSIDENFWIRRIAIDCQLGFKEATDTELLSSVIRNNLGSKEFLLIRLSAGL